MQRSQTDRAGVILMSTIGLGIATVGIWCWHRLVAHQMASDLSGFNISLFGFAQSTMSLAHSEILLVSASTAAGAHELERHQHRGVATDHGFWLAGSRQQCRRQRVSALWHAADQASSRWPDGATRDMLFAARQVCLERAHAAANHHTVIITAASSIPMSAQVAKVVNVIWNFCEWTIKIRPNSCKTPSICPSSKFQLS